MVITQSFFGKIAQSIFGSGCRGTYVIDGNKIISNIEGVVGDNSLPIGKVFTGGVFRFTHQGEMEDVVISYTDDTLNIHGDPTLWHRT
jgi:hypothetical protein